MNADGTPKETRFEKLMLVWLGVGFGLFLTCMASGIVYSFWRFILSPEVCK